MEESGADYVWSYYSFFSRYTVSSFVLFYPSIPPLFLSDLVSFSYVSFLSLLRFTFFPSPSSEDPRSLPALRLGFLVFPFLPGYGFFLLLLPSFPPRVSGFSSFLLWSVFFQIFFFPFGCVPPFDLSAHCFPLWLCCSWDSPLPLPLPQAGVTRGFPFTLLHV